MKTVNKLIKFGSLSLATGSLILFGSFLLPIGASKADVDLTAPNFSCPNGTFLLIDAMKGPSCVPPVQTNVPAPAVDPTPAPPPVPDTASCH